MGITLTLNMKKWEKKVWIIIGLIILLALLVCFDGRTYVKRKWNDKIEAIKAETASTTASRIMGNVNSVIYQLKDCGTIQAVIEGRVLQIRDITCQ